MGARNTYSTGFQLHRTKQSAKIHHGFNYVALKDRKNEGMYYIGIFAHKYFFCVTHKSVKVLVKQEILPF
jgi:hypothetical protein